MTVFALLITISCFCSLIGTLGKKWIISIFSLLSGLDVSIICNKLYEMYYMKCLDVQMYDTSYELFIFQGSNMNPINS